MKNRKVGKVAGAMALALSANVMSVVAQETSIIEVSSWAVEELNEGEKYGIFPITWYQEGFIDTISKERVQELRLNVRGKLSTLNEGDAKEEPSYITEDVVTREDVINVLYDELLSYQFDLPYEEDGVTYFINRGILQGRVEGLELDKACTVEEAVIFATRMIEDTYSTLELGSKGFVWEVQNNDVTMYLLGSIHVGDYNMYPIDTRLKDAFSYSDALLVEANLFDMQDYQEFLNIAIYQDGTTLKDNLSSELYEKMTGVVEGLGLEMAMFDMYKPWCVANDLNAIGMSESGNTEEAVLAALLGVDTYFMTTAMVNGKPIYELEGLKYQAELFDSLSMEAQEAYLNEVLEEIINPSEEDSSVEAVNMWQQMWCDGDIEGFRESYKEAIEGEQSELSQMLFGQRDKDMAEKLMALLEQDIEATYFVVVGAGHFVTEGTIIDIFENEGYEVQLFYR